MIKKKITTCKEKMKLEIHNNYARRHRRALKDLYTRHPLLEILVDVSFPFFFFLALVSFSLKSLQNAKYLLCAICTLSYFVTRKIPISLSSVKSYTVVSLSSLPYYAAFLFSVEALAHFVLLVSGFHLLFEHIDADTRVYMKRSEVYRGILEGAVVLVSSVYVFTLTASLPSLPERRKE